MPGSIKLKKLLVFAINIALIINVAKAQKSTEILWDNYGVPHIFGNTITEMYYAYGWSQMHSHANLIIGLYAQARGKAAEYYGKQYLNQDKKMLLFDLPQRAKKIYIVQDKEYKAYLDAFVKGMNAYLQAHPDEIEKSNKQVLPLTIFDVLAHEARVLCLEFLGGDDIGNAVEMAGAGSNSMAIGPLKSASKNTMLLTNPHLPWGDFFTFYEAHLSAPGFNAYGVSLAGFPTLNIAFNDHLGWTHTVNTIDASDRYELKLKDDGYVMDGVTVPFEKRFVDIKFRNEDGTIGIDKTTFKYTRHGPVITGSTGKAYAIRIAGLENPFINAQYHKMAKAQNFAAFEAALQMLQNPMFNVVYADQGGNIMYLFNGNVPVRPEGNGEFWHGTVDGSASKYIWTKYHPYADLPKLVNPSTGFVQNANDPPWTCTYPIALDPKKYPSYMSPLFMDLRPQRAVNMVKNDSSITFDELVAYKLNTGMEAADRFLDDLYAAVDQYPDTLAAAAVATLKAWDKAAETNSKGAILFTTWFDKLNDAMFTKQWGFSDPVTTPDGLKDPKKAVELLVQAAQEVKNKYGALDVPWGKVYRFKRGTSDFPANGAPGEYGVYRTMYYREDRNQKSYALAGDTYVAITEFGSKVKASVLLSYGNASQPGNKHVGDQLKLLSEKKLRAALLDKEAILQNLETRESLAIEGER